MKRITPLLIAAGLGFGVAMLWMNRATPLPSPDETVPAPTVAETPRADAEAGQEQNWTRPAAAPPAVTDAAIVPKQRTAEDILNELAALQVVAGPGQARTQYRILSLLDQLAQEGPAALPALHQFLAARRDVSYEPSAGTTGGNRSRNNSGMLPPSLRFGLLDVVRQIGGPEAEQILVQTAGTTGRGAELVYLAQLLEGFSPGKYRDTVLTAARNLIAGGKVTDPADRDNLYDLLRQFKDTAYVSVAQAQLVSPDGRVDRSALRYLQQTLGEQSLALAVRTYSDQRVADGDSKESLGRVALTYVGANDQALPLFHAATIDPALKPDQRRNLVEDLNQDGLSNRRNPTPEDLKVIANRYTLTQTYLQQEYVQNDKTLNAAFREANKDLANMLRRAGVSVPADAPPK